MTGRCENGVDARRLVALDIEKHQVRAPGGAGVATDPEFPEQIVLDQEQRGQQKRPEAEGQHDRGGLVGRPVEVGQSLAVQIGQPPRKPSPQGRDQPERGEPEDQHHHADTAGEDRPVAEVLDLNRRESDDAQRQEPERGPGQRVGPARGRFVGTPQGHERRDPADPKQRQQGKYEGHPEPQSDPDDQGLGSHGDLDIDRQEILHQERQQLLNADPERRADQAA